MKSNLILRTQVLFIGSNLHTILNLLIKPMWSESTFLSAKSTRRSNTSVYSNFVFRRCVIYKRLASIEAKFISTSTRSKELDHRTKRKIDCRYTIGITCWVSCLPTLTNVWSVKVSYREILDVSRETSILASRFAIDASPRVDPALWTDNTCLYIYRCRAVWIEAEYKFK